MMNKIFLFVLLVAGCLFLGNWLFNNFDAWLSIIFMIATVIAVINVVVNFYNKQNKKKDEKNS